MVICLERGADLHIAQLMPLPPTVSCFSKIQIGFTFLVPAHPGSPGQRDVKRVCVSGLFFVHDIKFLPQCQLLRNHCTIQKIAHAQYGNVSQSATKITSAATLVQYFRLRRHHGNKSRTAWFISRNTRRSSVVAVRFHFLVVRCLHTLNTCSSYASEAGA